MGVLDYHKLMGVLDYHKLMGVLDYHKLMGVPDFPGFPWAYSRESDNLM